MWPILIQRAICRLLNAHAYFSGTPSIPVIARASGDLESAVQNALAGLGACVVVGPADGSFVRQDTGTPTLSGGFTLTVFENVMTNRAAGGTGQPAEAISWAAADLLCNEILLHPDTGAALHGGPVRLIGFADAEVTTKEHGMRLISELTIQITGGSPATEKHTLSRYQIKPSHLS